MSVIIIIIIIIVLLFYLINKDWLVRNLQTVKTSPRVLKNALYKSLQLACIEKYFENFISERPRQPPEHNS